MVMVTLFGGISTASKKVRGESGVGAGFELKFAQARVDRVDRFDTSASLLMRHWLCRPAVQAL